MTVPGPVERFAPFDPPYKLEVGTGRNVGVVGRDEGVGMELVVLVVAVVLMLLRPSVEVDSLDCGRRSPEGATLWDKALEARLLLALEVGESIETEDMGRNAVGAEGGLDVRRRSLSLSLTGDGVSSMMSTQPDESPFGVRVRTASASRSTLSFRVLGRVANRSSLEA